MVDKRRTSPSEADKFEDLPVPATTDLRRFPERVDGFGATLRTVDAPGLLKTRIDEDSVTENVFYIGKAAPGVAENVAVWQVKRITVTEIGSPSKTAVDIDWANGDYEFDNLYSNREALSYS